MQRYPKVSEGNTIRLCKRQYKVFLYDWLDVFLVTGWVVIIWKVQTRVKIYGPS